MTTTYDVIVIGGGPGGYNCAIRAAQLGLKTACVDKRGTFGGTCLNVGCIPSKALLHASEVFEETAHFSDIGIKTGSVKLDLEAMMAHKDKSVEGLTKGVEYLFKKNKIDGIVGAAKLVSSNQVEVVKADGSTDTLGANAIVIATGSEPASVPGIEIDEQLIVSSTGALDLQKVPKRMIVIGGGYIGLEMGSVWRRLGSEVTVVEFLDRITPGMDGEVSKQFHRILEKQGMKFRLSTKVTGAKLLKNSVKLTVEPSGGGDEEVLEAEIVLMSIGRKPYTDALGLDAAGVTLDDRGRIDVDDHYRTNVEGIYAIGDVIAGPMLAHKAEDEAMAVAEIIAGQAGHVNYAVIPGVVYTYPEVASVGKTEEELKAAGVDYKVGKFPFS
ncbi:MAG: dihydrolipoyl dehydrogenase, partial [Pseudomonadota bacterium]